MTPHKQEFFNKIAGEFDTHVRQSIPLFDMFIDYVTSITVSLSRKDPLNYDVIDICGSTGSLGRKLLYQGFQGWYNCLDGSPKMEEIFYHLLPSQSLKCHFTLAGYMNSWEDESGTPIPEYEPYKRRKLDMALEILGFQFFTKYRAKEVVYTASIADTAIYFEKFDTPNFDANEHIKDSEHKSLFFNPSQLQDKRDTVLNDMNNYLYNQSQFEDIINGAYKNWKKIAQIGNFAGYICSNELAVLPPSNHNLIYNRFNA